MILIERSDIALQEGTIFAYFLNGIFIIFYSLKFSTIFCERQLQAHQIDKCLFLTSRRHYFDTYKETTLSATILKLPLWNCQFQKCRKSTEVHWNSNTKKCGIKTNPYTWKRNVSCESEKIKFYLHTNVSK